VPESVQPERLRIARPSAALAGDAGDGEAEAARLTEQRPAFDWQPTKLECLRCGGWHVTRELNPRCPYCGHRETPGD
jgi:rubrerythrin